MNPDVHEPDPHALYTIREVVSLTASSERKVVFYCRKGLLDPVAEDGGEWRFDAESLARLRHIEILRQQHRMNWAAIETILRLQQQIEALRRELRCQR
ncbi:MerR family transcriptional regulator [Haloferula sp. A504]|jgi:DNA-binding transcriptional MerR regulator|uniref:MerR family transcriptional regulator n=1 Tax=Haloferula sp. A504 TaxID=3373601 RepID=UPI0031C5133F|nr:MerR family transcriptional regulator [Verrucomicrobiaceae bacterium E54]